MEVCEYRYQVLVCADIGKDAKPLSPRPIQFASLLRLVLGDTLRRTLLHIKVCLQVLGKHYCVCIKLFVAPGEAAWSLIHCLKWCHFVSQHQLELKTTVWKLKKSWSLPDLCSSLFIHARGYRLEATWATGSITHPNLQLNCRSSELHYG